MNGLSVRRNSHGVSRHREPFSEAWGPPRFLHPYNVDITYHIFPVYLPHQGNVKATLLFNWVSGVDRGGGGARASPTTKNEAPAPKFYKIEAPEWQF